MRPSALHGVAAVTLLLVTAACGNGGGTDPVPPVIACTNAPGVSEAPSGEVIFHAAKVKVGTPIFFDLKQGMASITIVQQGLEAPASVTFKSGSTTTVVENLAVPFTVRSPSGVVYDDNQNFSSLTPTQREDLFAYVPAAGAGTGAIFIPATTGGLGLVGATGLPAGQWSVEVADLAWECANLNWSPSSCTGGWSGSTYDVTVIAKPLSAGAIPTSGTLDLSVYFATTDGGTGAPLSAATANLGNDADLQRMTTTLAGFFAKAGITLGKTTYHDLPAEVQTTYATGVDVTNLDACAPLAQLLKNGASGATLNVIFVSAILAPTVSGKKVVALDGAIPGPATIGGSTGSGIVVSSSDLRTTTNCSASLDLNTCGAHKIAYYIAHEAGHYLGLAHPTELYGYRFDALADTPRCSCSTLNGQVACKSSTAADTCATSDGTVTKTSHTMTVAECTKGTTCGGGDNLMFWTLAAGTSTGNLTAEQKKIMLANPLVH